MSQRDLDRLFQTFCHLWKRGVKANFNASARDGKTMARLTVEISHFSSKRTNGTQEDNMRTCSPPAGAAAGRKRRNRGPKSAARSRARATKHRAVVSAARKSKSETLLTGGAGDAENIPATQENPSTNKVASVPLSAVTGKEDVSVVTTDNITSQLEPHAANESSAFSRNLKVLQSPVESEGRRMIMTVGRSSRSPSFGQLDGLGREGDEQEKQEEKEQEEEKEEVKEREEEEEKAEKKTDDEGAHEAAYEDQGDQGWIPVSPRRRRQNAQVTTDEHLGRSRHTSNLSRIPRIYPCKFFLAGVNFYRFNAKNWHFRQILRKKVAFFTDLTRKIGVFRCKFYYPKILPV